MALSDGYIGTFDQKYDQNFWRPITAIREAATDGNSRTSPDPNYLDAARHHTAHPGSRLRARS